MEEINVTPATFDDVKNIEQDETPGIDMQEFKKHLDEISSEKQPMLGLKELKALKEAKYHKIAEKFDTTYVIQNKKTGMIVELRGASPLHAANSIGWRKNHVKLIEVKKAS